MTRKIGVVCCTYDRPQYVGQIIRCFLDQDYPRDLRELVILDDAGQYESQEGDRWRLISVPDRYPTLGHKRNACVDLLSPDVDAFCSWDDDDLYLPWAVSSCAAALEDGEWASPSAVFKQEAPDQPLARLDTTDESWALGAAWAMTVRAFRDAGGYGLTVSGEDTTLKDRLQTLGVARTDPLRFNPAPYFIWRRCPDTYHTSEIHALSQWSAIAVEPRAEKTLISIPDENPATAALRRLSLNERMMQL